MKNKAFMLLVFILILCMTMTGCTPGGEEIEEIEEIIEVITNSESQGTTDTQTPSNVTPNSTTPEGTTSSTTPEGTTSSTTPGGTTSSTTPGGSTSPTTPGGSTPPTSSAPSKPTGPNVPVLNCGIPTPENALSWAQTYGRELTWGKSYNLDSDLMIANIRPISLTGTYALKHFFEGQGGIRGAYAYVDFSKNEIGFKNPTNTSQTFKSKKCSFTFVANREYIVEHTIIGGETLTLTIKDTVDNRQDTIVYDDPRGDYYSRSTGVRTDEYNSSKVEVLSKKVYSLQPYNPQVLILGDSFVDGFYQTRYATLIKNKLNGSVFISGKSGGDSSDICGALEYLPSICQPKYVIIAIGTNDYVFSDWKTRMGKILKAVNDDFNKATPILATVTLYGEGRNAAFVEQANAWIRNSGYKYVDINKLTTVGGDMKTQDLSKFRGDKVHLTPAANEEVYNNFLSVVPELFK